MLEGFLRLPRAKHVLPFDPCRKEKLLFTKYPNLLEINLILLLVLFTIILVINPSIITDGLNYTLSTLTYGASFLSVDNHDVVVIYCAIPVAPSLLSAPRDYITPINQLAIKFQNNPEIAPSLLDYSIRVAEGTISVISSTVILAGVSVPVWGIAAIVLSAYSVYAFVTANQLKCIVHGMDLSREEIINLVTENPILGNRPSRTELNSITAERLSILLG